MKDILIYIPEPAPAVRFAAQQLERWGFSSTALPCANMTHALLGVPTRSMPLPGALPEDIVVFGGNITGAPYKTVDFLRDEAYLAANAAITAHCALQIAMDRLPVTLDGCKVLLIGWGRISKCLVPLMKALGAEVTVASRKDADRAILEATGFQALDTGSMEATGYRLIINTAPAPVLDCAEAEENAVLLDLASKQGISGGNVIWARGLPGKCAPESSGMLIAKTVLRYLGKEHI